jgi:hypothetical protein
MKETYFFLLLYLILIVFGSIFFLIPLVLIILSLLVAALSFYYGFNQNLADILMVIGTAPWRHWIIFFIVCTVICIGFLVFTHYVSRTSYYKKLRIKHEK